MKNRKGFAEGLGAGAAVVLAMAAATCLWQGARIADWLSRDGAPNRLRRQIDRAEREAKLGADYLDICRTAGI